jgi:hypothetical protein
MIVASRVEHTLQQGGDSRALSQFRLSGPQLLGLEIAARSYFGKPANELTLRKARSLPA